jgi:hypothetical protein
MDWTVIEDYLKTNTNESLTLALLEYDKILTRELRKPFEAHKNFDELLGATDAISNLFEVKNARSLLEKIVAIPNFRPKRDDLEKAINAYHAALLDLLAKNASLSVYERMFLIFKQLIFTAKGKRLKQIVIALTAFFVFVYILAGTAVGKAFGDIVVRSTNTAAVFVLSVLAVFVATLAVAAISLFFFDRIRRGQEIKKVSSDE